MYILGLNVFHPDAAACLVRDGEVVAAIAEERLGRREKHYAGFPAEAIRKVLDMGGIGIRDVETVAIGHNPRANFLPRVGFSLRNPSILATAARVYLKRGRNILDLQRMIADSCGFDPEDCRFEVEWVEHHQAHVASSFFSSGFDEAAAMTYDASGDFVSTMFAHCQGQDIDVLKRVYLPDSLGYFYTGICQFIGFDAFGEEYKVMGLAAYGEPRYGALMEKLAWPTRDGGFRLNRRYFARLGASLHGDTQGHLVMPQLYKDALVEELGPPRKRGSEITARDRDIAASLQKRFEEIVLTSLRWLHDKVPVDTLVTAGGAALNGVCNARILRDTPFKRTYIHCAAGDDGTAVGAALHVWNVQRRGPRSPEMTAAYLGPEHSTDEVREALEAAGVEGERLERDVLLDRAAEMLNDGKVIGWYQGRSEWGPRALGNRSILAHPGYPEMKDIINAKVKRRESFRPFAPTILADRTGDYFEQDVQSPFMMHVVRIREEKRGELSAVTHEDFTGRLHTVTRPQNEAYYDLIERFSRRSGTPVVLNTSFNENEPIVQTPAEALDCFLRNDLDALFLGDYHVSKEALSGVPAQSGESAESA